MALEIVESLFAIKAAVHRLASGGGKLADEFGVIRMTAGTFDSFFGKKIIGTYLLLWIRWRNAERF